VGCADDLGHQHRVGIKLLAIDRTAAISAELPGDGVAALELPPGQQLLAQLWRAGGQLREVEVQRRGPGNGALRSAAESGAKGGNGENERRQPSDP